MIPSDYSNYFTTRATVAATLFGLIFLVVSIAPESIAAGGASLERQVKASAAYLALSNPLIVSLFALLPHQEIGPAVMAVAGAGLLQMLVRGLRLVRRSTERSLLPRNGLFVLAGLILYFLERQDGLQLLGAPGDSSLLYTLGTLMIFILIYGVARAWELIGGRSFRIRDWILARDATAQRDEAAQEDRDSAGKAP